MCMTCGCFPCSKDCVSMSLTTEQQARIDEISPMLEDQGFHMYIIDDGNGLRHLCLTNSLDEHKNIDIGRGDFPYLA